MPNIAHHLRIWSPRLLLVSFLFVLNGCASVTPIRDLLNDPSRYDGKTVRIEGEVKGSLGGLGRGAYEVEDKTGKLAVVSDRSDPPRSGTKIGVKGQFDALLNLGFRSLSVLREESRSYP
jgi:hypothetical protein